MKLFRGLLLSLALALVFASAPARATVHCNLANETAEFDTDHFELGGAVDGFLSFDDAGCADDSVVVYGVWNKTKNERAVATGTIDYSATPDTLGYTEVITSTGAPLVFDPGDEIEVGDTFSAGEFNAKLESPVALGTDTSGNYAAGDGEAGNALTGDSATAFFSTGTIEDARIDGSAEVDEVLNSDLGDFTCTTGSCAIDGNAVALGTDTTGNYALGDSEGGAATTGDSATSFFSTGTLEDARIDGSAEADEVLNSDKGDFTCSAGSCAIDGDAVALGTDTSGVYVAQVADGTGIDGSCNAEGCTYTPTFDATELGALTWGSGSGFAWTFNAAGGTDQVFTFGNGTTTLGSGEFIVPTEAYDATNWNGDNSVPTKDAVRDKIETLGGATQTDALIVAVSGELQVLTTGTAKVSLRAPYAMTVTGVRCNVNVMGTALTVDINEGGTTILSTKVTIDSGELTSVDAASQPVISDSSIADDAVISFDIDTVTGTASGLKCSIIHTHS